jgi:hypothetical protein
VSGGQITLSVPAYTAYAFYTGAQPSGSAPPPPSTGRAIHPSAFSGKCLDIKDGVLADGTLLQLWDCANDVQQEFVFTSNGAGTSIQVVGTNFCLDAGSSPSNGSQLKIWTCYAGIAAQTWSFTEGGHVSNQGQCIDMTSKSSRPCAVLRPYLRVNRRRCFYKREHHADLGVLGRKREPDVERLTDQTWVVHASSDQAVPLSSPFYALYTHMSFTRLR